MSVLLWLKSLSPLMLAVLGIVGLLSFYLVCLALFMWYAAGHNPEDELLEE